MHPVRVAFGRRMIVAESAAVGGGLFQFGIDGPVSTAEVRVGG
jgi:hypothetical protein